jgi:hypothetical protein
LRSRPLYFSDRLPGILVSHIYAPQQSGFEVQGASSLDTPPGTTVYDANSLLGGASGPAGGPFTAGSVVYTYGNQFTAALYAAPGAGDSISSLLLVPQYEGVMRQTSLSEGPEVLGTFIPNAITGTDPGIPNTPVASPVATVAVAAWYNDNGTITSLAQAQAEGVPYGESLPVTIPYLGESGANPPITPANLVGVQSFSLVGTVIPEPGTIALGLMGVCGFLARRRKSQVKKRAQPNP